MNPKYIYLLWFGVDGGPDELVATLDRNKVLSLAVEKCIGWHKTNSYLHRKEEPPESKLKSLLLETDEKLLSESYDGAYALMDGWGGLHFQVVRLS